jgi:hypothetical protein
MRDFTQVCIMQTNITAIETLTEAREVLWGVTSPPRNLKENAYEIGGHSQRSNGIDGRIVAIGQFWSGRRGG